MHKSVPKKLSEKNVSYKSVPQNCFLQECQKLLGCLSSNTCLHAGSWVPFCCFPPTLKLGGLNLSEVIASQGVDLLFPEL